jgi:hypothetical protein
VNSVKISSVHYVCKNDEDEPRVDKSLFLQEFFEVSISIKPRKIRREYGVREGKLKKNDGG